MKIAADPLWLVERDHILSVLSLCKYNRTDAARALEISIRSLRIKIRQYQSQGLEIPDCDGIVRSSAITLKDNERPPLIKILD